MLQLLFIKPLIFSLETKNFNSSLETYFKIKKFSIFNFLINWLNEYAQNNYLRKKSFVMAFKFNRKIHLGSNYYVFQNSDLFQPFFSHTSIYVIADNMFSDFSALLLIIISIQKKKKTSKICYRLCALFDRHPQTWFKANAWLQQRQLQRTTNILGYIIFNDGQIPARVTVIIVLSLFVLSLPIFFPLFSFFFTDPHDPTRTRTLCKWLPDGLLDVFYSVLARSMTW